MKKSHSRNRMLYATAYTFFEEIDRFGYSQRTYILTD